MSGSDLAGSGRIETKDDRGHECGRHTLVEHHREHRVFIDGRRHVFNHEIGAGLRDILAPERDLFGSAAFEIHLADALAQRFNIDLGHRVILSILTLLSPARFLNKSLDAAVTRFTMRSEEHTSELQSLMRISYAVFCLQNK